MSALPTILLAEDDENDVLFLQRAFREAGIENPVSIARDGQDTIDYLAGAGKFADRSKHPLPRLLILDLKMPRKSGMEVLEWRRDQPELDVIPVIVLSSSAHRYDIELAYRLGTNSFVVKPPGLEERRKLACHIKDFWLGFNEPPIVCIEGVEESAKVHASAQMPHKFI